MSVLSQKANFQSNRVDIAMMLHLSFFYNDLFMGLEMNLLRCANKSFENKFNPFNFQQMDDEGNDPDLTFL